MTKVDVISGFLGAGKTTLIKKLLEESLQGEKVVLIENEFGEIAIDGGFLKDSGIQINEMNSGCICCSLVGDFGKALREVLTSFHPDRILIEPSGVGKLSDVLGAVAQVADTEPEMALGNAITVADATKCGVYMRNFGEFYVNQVANAATIVLSRTQNIPADKVAQVCSQLREKNPNAAIISTPWDQLSGDQILSAMDGKEALAAQLLEETRRQAEQQENHEDGHCCGHHDHDHEDGHCHGHHGHDHEDGHCCGHHGHDHEDGHCCGHHDHDHEGGHCHGHHDHDHEGGHCHGHHDHHADEVFSSWGVETPKHFTPDEITTALETLDQGGCGTILRAKGILPGTDGQWLHFDYVPGEHQVRTGSADYTGRLCVIGADLKEDALKSVFGV